MVTKNILWESAVITNDLFKYSEENNEICTHSLDGIDEFLKQIERERS